MAPDATADGASGQLCRVRIEPRLRPRTIAGRLCPSSAAARAPTARGRPAWKIALFADVLRPRLPLAAGWGRMGTVEESSPRLLAQSGFLYRFGSNSMRRPQIEKRSSKRPVRQYVADTHHDRKSFAEMRAARRSGAWEQKPSINYWIVCSLPNFPSTLLRYR